MSLEPAFSQRAEAVMAALGGLGQVPDAAAVLAEIAGHGPNPGAALAERLRVPGAIGVGPALPAPLAELARLAAAEAHRAGLPRTGCEHLVLALVRIADGASDAPAALPSARAELQGLIGDAAGAAYARLPRRDGEGDGEAGTSPCGIVLCGLPGTGKSTLADLAAARLGLSSFSFDWFLGSLTPLGSSGLTTPRHWAIS